MGRVRVWCTLVLAGSARERGWGLKAPLLHVPSGTGHLSGQALRRAGAAGWRGSRMLLSALCLAAAAPGACLGLPC